MISCSHESLQTHENIWLMAWEPSSSALLWGREHGGKREWEKTRVPPEFWCSGPADAEGLLHAFHVAPGGCLAM